MGNSQTVEIMVCERCRPAGAPPDEPRAGRAFFEAMQDMAFVLDTNLIVRPIECMSACKRSCAVALQSVDKTTYLFGDLAPDVESAQQVISCAQLYQSSADGVLLRADRPERLREGILARLPAPCHSNRSIDI